MATCIGADLAPAGLLSELRAYSDSYEWDSATKRYLLKRPESLEAIVAAHYKSNHNTLDDLVSCMSDESTSRVLLNEKTVALGVVCYEGLTKLVYFEPGSSKWPGYVEANASHEQLVAAQKAYPHNPGMKALVDAIQDTFESYTGRRENFGPHMKKKLGSNWSVAGHNDHIHLSVN
jgi:hypothetical protein